MKQLWDFMPSIRWAVPQQCIDNLKEDAWKVVRREGGTGRAREGVREGGIEGGREGGHRIARASG